MARMISRKPDVFFPGRRLPWRTPAADGMHGIPMPRGALSLLLAIAILAFVAGAAMADHDVQTYSFEFSGSNITAADRQQFIIHNDGALYFKLKSVVKAAPTTHPITIGFNPEFQQLCGVRYVSTIENPTVGATYGPYYVTAGTYYSYYYLGYVKTTSYQLEIEYRRQLTPNDTEPNESVAGASDIGNISPNDHITGHLAYLNTCDHNKHDYIRFGMLSSGSYQVKIHFDPTFSDKTGCEVYFALLDDTAHTWMTPTYVGPTDTTLGPYAFQAGRQYVVSMESSYKCYDFQYISYTNCIVGNKAGAYDIQIYDPAAPPPPTISLAGVKEAQMYLDKKPNQKYVIVEVKNTGTSSQAGYIEITAVNNLTDQHVFSDHRDISVPAATTKRYEFHADTTNWPATEIKATASLYTANKQQFIGSDHAHFVCGKHRGINPALINMLNELKK